MRDLEIRGAGNLLGRDQSGHISAVGYDLYVRMVSEAVAELKGEPIRLPVEITVDLPVKASIPESYIGREDLRLEAYRRLVDVPSPAAVADIAGRVGRTATVRRRPQAQALLAVGRLRAECVRTGVAEVTAAAAKPGASGPGRLGEVVVRMSPVRLAVSSQVRLEAPAPRAILKEDAAQLIVPLAAGADLADRLVGELLRAPSSRPEVTGPGSGPPPTIGGS